MSRQILTKSQLTEELNTVFKNRIKHLKDEIGRREKTPYSDPEVQFVSLAKFNYKLSVAVIAQDQIQDLIKEHVKR